MEAEEGIEPSNDGFANHCLTTWLLRHSHGTGASEYFGCGWVSTPGIGNSRKFRVRPGLCGSGRLGVETEMIVWDAARWRTGGDVVAGRQGGRQGGKPDDSWVGGPGDRACGRDGRPRLDFASGRNERASVPDRWECRRTGDHRRKRWCGGRDGSRADAGHGRRGISLGLTFGGRSGRGSGTCP
jgi:hypothetical protein